MQVIEETIVFIVVTSCVTFTCSYPYLASECQLAFAVTVTYTFQHWYLLL